MSSFRAVGWSWLMVGLAAGAAMPAAAAAPQPQACGEASACSAAEFGARLVRLADEQDPNAVPGDFAAAFGAGLARYTRVVVSTLLPTDSQNNVKRFVQLGDAWYPLSLGAPGDCVSFGLLDGLFRADGWAAARTAAPGAGVWTYEKWRRKVSLSARDGGAAAGNGTACVGSIVLTYR